jgi:hypothetical protein
VRAYELTYQKGSEWVVFAKGTTIGPDCLLKFEPVTAQVVRLNLLKADEGPTIWEFHLLPPKQERK